MVEYSEIPYSVFQVKRNETSRRTYAKQTNTRKENGNFPHNVATMISEVYLRDSRKVVDPFAGWGERHVALQKLGIPYVGFDISSEAREYARRTYGVHNHAGDARRVFVPNHDGLITCPPYWNIEKYNSKQGLDRLSEWQTFLEQYEGILSRFASKCAVGGIYCIVTGNWRSEGVYYQLTYETEKIMERLGFVKHDMVVLSRKGLFNPCIQLPQSKKFKRSIKCHETLNVWVKA